MFTIKNYKDYSLIAYDVTELDTIKQINDKQKATIKRLLESKVPARLLLKSQPIGGILITVETYKGISPSTTVELYIDIRGIQYEETSFHYKIACYKLKIGERGGVMYCNRNNNWRQGVSSFN